MHVIAPGRGVVRVGEPGHYVTSSWSSSTISSGSRSCPSAAGGAIPSDMRLRLTGACAGRDALSTLPSRHCLGCAVRIQSYTTNHVLICALATTCQPWIVEAAQDVPVTRVLSYQLPRIYMAHGKDCKAGKGRWTSEQRGWHLFWHAPEAVGKCCRRHGACVHASVGAVGGGVLPGRARWQSRRCHSRRSARAAAPPSASTWGRIRR